ncbi:hypothetical protein CC1G_01455 [Coprinopsis cinerea okayama7|uniref:Spindle pole body component n=1 Tax=Coprinopsis cinerea (strain Okayama-7 / 130 / ATCC MYA-4618 / FGSC 9003) TaxID=240176 RepID=A8NYW6_COPC7|nr:hypothetical protein CC1G_01455 [Coprinopsis cinerea okayama7\|eukprot:XP_001837543.2 hypothetical protein CC1G_01455 [Coprinopsis cinerea okayama7\
MNPSGSSRSLHTPVPRPVSSLSVRPSSSSRPSSSISQHRPSTSIGFRPPSSASHRTQSRLSFRPPSRSSRSRIIPQCQTLVTQVTGIEDQESDDFKDLVEYAYRQLEPTTISKPSASVDIEVIDRTISGHALKARVNLKEELATSLEHCYRKLKDHIESHESDLDAPVVSNKIPDHLQFLIALAQPPSAASLAYADLYLERVKNPQPSTPPLTWAEILAEEPFEGDHWEGILDPIGDDWDTTPSLSPLNSDDLALDDDDSSLLSMDEAERAPSTDAQFTPPQEARQPFSPEHAKAFRELQHQQYWRKEWRSDADPSRSFDLGDPSTLGPSIERAGARTRKERLALDMLAPPKYINEEDMVREVLIALQGRENTVFTWENDNMVLTSSPPRLIHLSLQSQASILESLGKTATTVQHLRHFVAHVFAQSANRITSADGQSRPIPNLRFPQTKTAEAFADAIDFEIRKFEAWCAEREEDMCRAGLENLDEPLVVSLLNTEQTLRNEYDESFEILSTIVRDVFGYPAGSTRRKFWRSSATLSTALLDTLFSHLQEHMERNAVVTGNTLLRVFVSSSEPIWGMVGKWLRNGMNVATFSDKQNPGDLEEEFFIEYNGIGVGMLSMGLLDPDFWKDGYSLRELSSETEAEGGTGSASRQSVVPTFLEHVAKLILGTGKATGLIRALGVPLSAHGFADWPLFADLVRSHPRNVEPQENDDGPRSLFSVSVDSLSAIINDHLREPCHETGAFLSQLLFEDCDLRSHVNALEDLFLMRKGDAITHFLDVVFTKMDANQAWSDFHFLNTAFGDVVRSNLTPGSQEWIQLSLVRLSYRGHRDKDRNIHRTVRAIEGLSVEYAVPFPLTYIFRPEIVQIYSEIFVFLLQIRRAKHVLERILIREDNDRHQRLKEELKVFYAMRSRLSWFANTLLNFLTTYVLHVQILKFHEDLDKAKSLDEIITLHDDHLDKIQGRCLLKPNASALHKSIISILDICLHFTNIFVTFAGDTTATHDVSRHSIVLKHRSRKQRRIQRNVIGFSHSIRDIDLVSSDDSDPDEMLDESEGRGPPDTTTTSFLYDETMGGVDDGDFFGRIEKISREVDGLVRFIRRGVESLAGGTTEAAPAFGVLAFALEDWDL